MLFAVLFPTIMNTPSPTSGLVDGSLFVNEQLFAYLYALDSSSQSHLSSFMFAAVGNLLSAVPFAKFPSAIVDRYLLRYCNISSLASSGVLHFGGGLVVVVDLVVVVVVVLVVLVVVVVGVVSIDVEGGCANSATSFSVWTHAKSMRFIVVHIEQ